MSSQLDHAVVVVPSLAQATRDFGAAGFTVLAGGRHDALPTENALVCFADGTYLELLATRDPATRDELRGLRASDGWERHLRGISAVARRFLPCLAGPDGVADWALGAASLASVAAGLRAQGIAAAGPVAMIRERKDGERVAWELLLPESALHPFWIADRTPRERRVPAGALATTHANRARGIAVVRVHAPSVPVAALALGDALDARPALRPDGVSALELGGWRVELAAGEPAGARAVRLAGCAPLPQSVSGLGVLAAEAG